MKQGIRKLASLALAMSLTAGLAVGCGNNETADKNSEAADKSVLKNGKFDPPIEMKIYGEDFPDFKFKNGETLENNVLRIWEEENLGIKMKYLWVASSTDDGYGTKAKLDLSANNPLPDMITTGDSVMIQNYIETGKFIDVSEVFDKYASEDLKRILSENKDAWNIASKDGKHYGIPLMWDTVVEDTIPWVRQDWLDKLGMSQPKTLDEFDKVLDAFVNKDPDGNGKKDTTGIALGWKSPGSRGAFNRNFADSSFVFGAYGQIPSTWVEDGKGGLVYSSTLPEIKQGLAKLREWVEKGYVDKEAGTYDSMKATEAVLAGKSGIVSGPHWLNVWPLPDLLKNDPKAKMVPILNPTGPDGKTARYSHNDVISAVLINKDFKHPEAVVLYMNRMLDAYMHKNGFENGFAEGYDYATVNGQVTWDDAQIPGGWVNVSKYTALTGGQLPQDPKMGLNRMLALNVKDPKPENNFDKQKIAEHGSKELPTVFYPAQIVNEQISTSIKDKFVGAPTPTMMKKSQALSKLEEETFLKIIYGQEPIDAFDEFVKKWNAQGGEQITKEVNDWYKSVNQK